VVEGIQPNRQLGENYVHHYREEGTGLATAQLTATPNTSAASPIPINFILFKE
jgi:hypothetical protein